MNGYKYTPDFVDGGNLQCTRIHDRQWSYYRLVYLVDQRLHILLKEDTQITVYSI